MDIGWTELLLIGIVALIVVGPKDLPGMFRTLGRFTAKAKSMAREFSRAMEDAAKESGVNETAADLRKLTSKKALGLDALEDAAKKFEKWDPMKPADASKDSAKGPATQALADKKSAEAATRAEAASAKTSGAAKAAAKPAVKAATKAAAKPATKAATKAAPKVASKPVAKPTAATDKPKAVRKPPASKAASKAPAPKANT